MYGFLSTILEKGFHSHKGALSLTLEHENPKEHIEDLKQKSLHFQFNDPQILILTPK